MNTILLKTNPPHMDNSITAAADILQKGGLVAIPTETVYGLAANALDSVAVSGIFAAKGRPQDNPLIIHIAALADWASLVEIIPPKAMTLAVHFWPGPLTIILKKSALIPDEISGGLDTVAVRCPSHPIAHAIIKAAGIPLAAPSANLSGSPSPTTSDHVLADLDGRINAIVEGGMCAVGLESTVISFTEAIPRLLRPGAISPREIEAVIGKIAIDQSVLSECSADTAASSPGMKYKHYAPKANVVLIKGASEDFARYANANAAADTVALCFDEDLEILSIPSVSIGSRYDYNTQAHLLFDTLRKLDTDHYKTILAHSPDAHGTGLAVYNRLLRSAAFEVIEV